MRSSSELQEQLFLQIKNKLDPHLSLADELASILNMSTDSVYRRIRGEKQLDLEELYRLCTHFKISLDSVLHLQEDFFKFTGSFVQPLSFRFDQYLKLVAQQVSYMSEFKDRKVFYLCKDIPLFHHFQFRELAAFKHYVWMKGIFNTPEFANKKFSLNEYPEELFQLGQKALNIYNNIESVEIWNMESINSTIRQIEFYHESKLFKSEEEVDLIYEALEKLLNHLELQADLGYKFNAQDNKQTPEANFQMYFNEIIIGDNSVLAILDGSRIGYIIHTVINIMMTRDLRFCDNMYETFQNIMKRSTLISSVSERERSRFFKNLRNRINSRRQNSKT